MSLCTAELAGKDGLPKMQKKTKNKMGKHAASGKAANVMAVVSNGEATEQFGMPQHGSEPEPKDNHGAKVAAIVAGCIIGVLAVVYLAGFAAFSFVFMPNTTLNGADVSLKLASEVSATYGAKASTYQAQISGDGIDMTIKGNDINLTFDQSAYAKSIISQQHAYSWPLHIMQTHELEAAAGATFSSDKLKAALEPVVEEINATATQPTDATVAFSETTQQYEVVAEKLGTAIDFDALLEKVESELAGMPARIVLDDSCLVQASVTSEEPSLATAAENANRYMKADIPLTLSGQAAGEVTREQISTWIKLDENLNATLDEEKLKAWVKSEVAQKYDTRGSERTYTRPDGKQITVAANSSHWDSQYGWTTDENALYESLKAAIEAGSTEAIEIPTKYTASQVPDSGRKDWGNRYIDIDLTEQYVRMYDDSGSLIWESACVTGDHAKGYDTPTGVYVLNSYRASGDVELRGATDPTTGEPSYISHVAYWMPFIDNAWALHDASWRSNFGGTIYQYGGSHGCVNLPTDKAAELYNLCKVGDVVVVHN